MNKSILLKKDYLKFYHLMFWFFIGLSLITLFTLAWVSFFNDLPLFLLRLNQYSRPLMVFLKVMWLVFVYFTLNEIKPAVKKYHYKYYIKIVMIIMVIAFFSYITIVLTQGRSAEVIFSSLYSLAVWLDILSQIGLFLLILIGYGVYTKHLLKDSINPLVIIISIAIITTYNSLVFFGMINTLFIVDMLIPFILFVAYIALRNSLYKISEY